MSVCYLFCFTCLHNAFMHVDMYTEFTISTAPLRWLKTTALPCRKECSSLCVTIRGKLPHPHQITGGGGQYHTPSTPQGGQGESNTPPYHRGGEGQYHRWGGGRSHMGAVYGTHPMGGGAGWQGLVHAYIYIYKYKLDDGWPESVEEQGLLLLVWRHHITKHYIKDVL